jgi:hypothetical protein
MGGGGSSGPTETTNITSNLPEYVQPYFERLLQRSEGESIQGYQPYGGQRLAYFSPDELQSQAMTRGFANAGTPSQYGTAETRFTNQGAYGQPLTPAQTAAGQTAYTSYTAPQNAAGLSVGPSGYSASADQTGALTAPGGYSFSPTTDGYTRGYTAPSASAPITSGYDPTALDTRLAGRTTYDPTANLRSSAYTAGTTAQTYNPLGYEQNISRFMSPYQQNVTDIEKREAARQSEIMGKGIGDQATAQGGLGGYREAIQQSERERNLSQQMGDIQSRGSQSAYENAQAQLERERAGGMGAARFGLDAFTQQQAAQQQQEQLAQRAFETSEQSRQQQETFAQSAFNAGESARQQAAQLGLSAQQQQEAAEQAQEKFSQSGYQMQQAAKQAAGSQQIAAYQAQQQALQAQGAQGIQAYQAQEDARQAQEKFQQSAYDMSNRYNLAAAQGLQGIGSAQQQDALSRIQALQGIGSQDRALRQASMDMGYDDFQRQRDFAKNQLSDFSGMLRGVPVQPNQTTSTYSQQPGLFQGAVSAGLGGLGLYRGMGG